jgi:hypothetical protein
MLTAKQLQSGDILAGSGAVIHRIYRDGLFAHGFDGKPIEPRRPYPKGRVEVFVSYPGGPIRRDEWNARTTVSILPERASAVQMLAAEHACDGVRMVPVHVRDELIGHVAELSKDGEVLYVANVLLDGTVDDFQDAVPA